MVKMEEVYCWPYQPAGSDQSANSMSIRAANTFRGNALKCGILFQSMAGPFSSLCTGKYICASAFLEERERVPRRKAGKVPRKWGKAIII